MICKRCKAAGQLVRATKTLDESVALEVLALAEEYHGKCRGGDWCDCHHLVPERADGN